MFITAKINKQKWITGLFYLSCLFPFVSPVPIETDVQPLFIVFAIIMIANQAWYVGLSKDKYFLIAVPLIFLIYIDTGREYRVDIGKTVSLVAGVLTYIATTKINNKQAFSLVKIAALVYFCFSCLIFMNTEVFLGIQKYFVRAINVADMANLDYRGTPTLATEPGLLGGLLVFLLIQLRYYGRMANASAQEMLAYGVAIVLTIVMTKSGTGYFYLLIFLMLSYGHRIARNRYVGLGLLAAVLTVLVLVVPIIANLELNNRGVEILITLVSGGDLDADTSVLRRLYDLRIGIASLLDYPFGVGINGVSATVNELAVRYNLLREQDFAGDISLVSGLSYYFVSYGLFGVLFILYLFLFDSRAPLLHKVFALIYLSASYSPAFPAIWILLSQESKKKMRSVAVKYDQCVSLSA